MSNEITLAEAKLHCRIDVNDEDTLIQAYIDAALEVCQQHIGKRFDSGLAFTPAIRVGCLMFVSHLYDNREPVNIGNITTEIPFTIGALWSVYRDPGVY